MENTQKSIYNYDTQLLEEKKYYSQRAVAGAAYIGGPLAAAYIIKKNFDAMGQTKKGKNSMFIGIIGTIFFAAIVLLIPEEIMLKIPKFLIPAIYTAIAYYFVEAHQGKILDAHKNENGKFYSIWRSVLVGAIFLLIIFGIALSAYLVYDAMEGPTYDTAAYSQKMEEFTNNEVNAIQVFDESEFKSNSYLLKEIEKGKLLWKENIEIINGLTALEILPLELKKQNKKLLKYCDLRIQLSDVLIKSFEEDTEIYIHEIERISADINILLKDIKTLYR